MDAARSHLPSGRELVRNSLWNFVGLFAPLLVAVFAIPYLIDGFGEERFGLLAIIWMGVGYFSLFDMGLGRALTKLIAERLSRDVGSIKPLLWTALPAVLILGLAGSLLIGLSASYVIQTLLNVPQSLVAESIAAFRILAVAIPVVVLTSALTGILEAHQQFKTITLIRVPLGALTFLTPLIVLIFTKSLFWVTVALVSARLVAMILFFLGAAACRRELYRPAVGNRHCLKALLTFGGWLTVSNIVSPIMVYLDRFLIGSLLSMNAVAYYVTPYEVISRLQVLPRSVVGVLFPALTATNVESNRFARLYSRSVTVVAYLMLPILGCLFLFSDELLTVWLGPAFGQHAGAVARWLAIGWYLTTLSRMALTLLQSMGRPDLAAKAHLVELVPYLATVWYLTSLYGIEGTALAWFLRALIDTGIVHVMALIALPSTRVAVRNALILIGVVLGLAWIGANLPSQLLRGGLLLVSVVVSLGKLLPILRSIFSHNSAYNVAR